MREIKFRAWDETDEQFIGDFVVTENGDVYVNDDSEMRLVDVILMQYTGLRDRYKKEIYEGDITTNELYESEGLAFVVYYDNEEGMFKQQPFIFKDNGKKLGNEDLTLQMDSVVNKEVIGNIYENPELLEVAE